MKNDELLGPCGQCGITQWGEPHNHRTYGTLTPEAAHAYWETKKEAQHASESRQ